ncbi:hypothetical protein VTN00DRAFT_9101 [Thermoascus crustaceus]|uniref:uncharacterized protein n=1 Tax=Thermoascus crustaceus TaxID=5088 RepID=UPI0037448D14
MKRIFGSLNKRASQTLERTPSYPEDSPEATILREVKAFCESGGGPNHVGDEYLHLPAIVEAAESSPNAAKEAALCIRKFLSYPATAQPGVQYNAVMLIRILSDNPGHTFTRNIDVKFVSTVKDLLREGRDMGVQQILRETLDIFEAHRSWDEDLKLLLQMWTKERYAKAAGQGNIPRNHYPQHQNYFNHRPHRTPRPTTLPPPDELSARISEARTSAKLLLQLVQSTPPAEMLGNDLIKEFSMRCQSASGSIQGYINCDNPAPDEDTLLTLIETNDQLSVALSKYQRGILNARKTLGADAAANNGTADATPTATATAPSPSPSPPTEPVSSGAVRPVPPPPPPPRNTNTDLGSPISPIDPTTAAFASAPISNGTGSRYQYNSDDFQVQNPFADSNTTTATNNFNAATRGGGRKLLSAATE